MCGPFEVLALSMHLSEGPVADLEFVGCLVRENCSRYQSLTFRDVETWLRTFATPLSGDSVSLRYSRFSAVIGKYLRLPFPSTCPTWLHTHVDCFCASAPGRTIFRHRTSQAEPRHTLGSTTGFIRV